MNESTLGHHLLRRSANPVNVSLACSLTLTRLVFTYQGSYILASMPVCAREVAEAGLAPVGITALPVAANLFAGMRLPAGAIASELFAEDSSLALAEEALCTLILIRVVDELFEEGFVVGG